MINISSQLANPLSTLFNIQSKSSHHQFHNVRSLELSYINWVYFESMSSDPSWFPDWDRFCLILASMKQLQHLQIWMEVFNYGSTHLTPTQEANFFIPYYQLKVYVISLSRYHGMPPRLQKVSFRMHLSPSRGQTVFRSQIMRFDRNR